MRRQLTFVNFYKTLRYEQIANSLCIIAYISLLNLLNVIHSYILGVDYQSALAKASLTLPNRIHPQTKEPGTNGTTPNSVTANQKFMPKEVAKNATQASNSTNGANSFMDETAITGGAVDISNGALAQSEEGMNQNAQIENTTGLFQVEVKQRESMSRY